MLLSLDRQVKLAPMLQSFLVLHACVVISESGKNEPNPVLQLARQDGAILPAVSRKKCIFYFTCKSHIINPSSVKMVGCLVNNPHSWIQSIHHGYQTFVQSAGSSVSQSVSQSSVSEKPKIEINLQSMPYSCYNCWWLKFFFLLSYFSI